MHLDPIIPPLALVSFFILLIGIVLKKFQQPFIFAYLLAGMALGPQGFGLISDPSTLSRLGALGVDLLLFLVGLEISLPRFVSNWRITVAGTLFQILASIFCVFMISLFVSWPLPRIILLGFVISLSSTAVVLKILKDEAQLETQVGQNITGILLAQDLAFIPMLMIISLLGEGPKDSSQIFLQLLGTSGIGFTLFIVWKKGKITSPLRYLGQMDREMQVFAALGLCFGLALMTSFLGLSTALGAFIAGILLAETKETKWAQDSLNSFQVVFLGFFFVSVGMLVDLHFIWKHLLNISLLVLAVIFTNTFINAVILYFSDSHWKRSLYGGALLSQIGEFSFVLVAVGLQQGIISNFSYQMTIALISLSILFCTFWVGTIKKLTKIQN